MEKISFAVPTAVLNPDHVFSCGQTFRYRKDGNVWRGVALGSLVEASCEGGVTMISVSGGELSESAWRRYFDLGRDYTALFPKADPVLQAAAASAPGLRVLNQDPFETLISFIISANNNIPRISRIVQALCDEAGTAFSAGGRFFHSFPAPDQLLRLSEARLRELGVGYRAPYLLASAEKAAGDDLDMLRSLPTGQVLRHLEAYSGVGPKVAGCIALFSLGKADAFPADVWIRRVVRELYGFDGTPAALQQFAGEHFGAHAGIAQQYLFHYARRYLRAGT